MSEQDQAGGGEPAGGDFVSRLVSDPANPPQTTLLSGYLGASDEEGHTRIYFDPRLSDYVDVADDDVLHSEPAGGSGPLAPTLVWIKRDAQVLHGRAGSTRQRAGFFEGRVWRENFGATVAGAPFPPRPMYGPPAPGPLSAPPCPTVAACRTQPPFCFGPSAVDACPTARCVSQACRGPEGSAEGGDADASESREGGEDTGVQGSGGVGADTVSYGSGSVGTDTVNYGSGGFAPGTVNYGPGGFGPGFGGGPGILPSEWCPSAGLPCPPRTLRCPPPTFGCPPRTALCPRTPFCGPRPTLACPSAVDACPTRFCPPG